MRGYYRAALGNLLNLCWIDMEVTRHQVEKAFPIKSKTLLTKAIKDLLEEGKISMSDHEYLNHTVYLANIMRAIIYLTLIRDEVVGNKTFGGRRDYQ